MEKVDRLVRVFSKKDRVLTIRVNSELLRLLEEAIREEGTYRDRTDFLTRCILNYLVEKGKLSV